MKRVNEITIANKSPVALHTKPIASSYDSVKYVLKSEEEHTSCWELPKFM